MGITFRYDAAAGLIGAYGAGQASGRARGQKYAMAALLQQQRNLPRMLGRGPARGIGARSRAAGQQIAGWDDPLDSSETLTPRQLAASRRARDRKARLTARGKNYSGSSFGSVPAESMPTPITQDDLDLAAKKADEQRKWGHEAKVRNRETAGKQREARVANLPPIPEDLAKTDPELYRKLTQQRSGVMQMVTGGELDFDAPDGAAQESLDDAIDSYENTISNLPAPDMNKGGMVFDPAVGFRFTNPGEVPTHWSMGPGVEPAETAGYQAQRAKEQADATLRAKAEEKVATEAVKKQQQIDKLRGEKIAAQRAIAEFDTREADANPEAKQTYQDELDLIQEQLDRLNGAPAATAPATAPATAIPSEAGGQLPIQGDIGAQVAAPPPAQASTQASPPLTPGPQMPSEPVQPPAAQPEATGAAIAGGPRLDLDNLNPQHFYGGKMHDKPRALPKGMPAGSRWVDNAGTIIKLPDGRIIRWKGR